MIMSDDALLFKLPPVATSIDIDPFTFSVAFVVTLSVLHVKLVAPLDAFISMSPSAVSMVTTLLALSSTILFFLVESTRMTRSEPSVSSKMSRWPVFDLITRMLFLPSPLSSGGICFLFQIEPMTMGRLMSPCSNTTSIWSSTSGRKYVPRSLPAMGTAMRAQYDVS